MGLSRPTSPTLLPTLRVRGTSRVSFECLLSSPCPIEDLLASHQLHLPQVHTGFQRSLRSPERFRQDCVISLRPCVCTAGYLQTCTCSQLPLSAVKCLYLCSSHTTFTCDILQHVRKAPQSYTTTAHMQFVSGLDQYFPKDSSSKDLARKSPKGISVVHQCPSFHFLSCTLSVCSSWSLFFSFLKVTSTAMCLSLCVRAVISSHLQHAAADYLNVNLFTPQNMQERRERS